MVQNCQNITNPSGSSHEEQLVAKRLTLGCNKCLLFVCFSFCLESLSSTVLFSSFRDRQTLTVGILVAKSVSGSVGHRAAISFCPANHCQPRAAAFVFPTSPLLYFSDLSICISSNSSLVFAPPNCCGTPFPFSSCSC